MKLKSMTATFGRLEGETLTFEDGLNLIHGPNEGGKSTWCAFWRAMLYGIDTRDRDRAGRLADKNRYQPWSGSPMQGELNLEWKGSGITIRRGPRGNVPFGAFSAVYTGTGEPVPFLTAQNCGEMLTGVGREVFERSALIGGGELAVSAAPELEKRIAAIVSSGREDVSYSQVEGRLKEWLNRRKVNRSVGLIPRLEEELAGVTEKLARMSGLTAEISRLEGEQLRLTRQLRAWESQRDAHEALARQELDQRFTLAQSDWEQARARLAALEQECARFGRIPDREKLKRAQGELQYLKVLDEEIQSAQSALTQAEDAYVRAQRAAQDSKFAGMTPDEAAERAQSDLADYRDCMEAARSKQSGVKLFPVAAVALSAVYLVFRTVLGGAPASPDFFAAGLITAGGVLLAFLSYHSGSQFRLKAARLLTRWGVTGPDELEELMEEYRRRCQRTELAANDLKNIRGTLNDKLARKENDITDLMSFVHTFAPEVTALFGCSAALSRALNLDFDLASARERVRQCALRRDDLAAQGAKLTDGAPAVAPTHSPEECRAALNALTGQARQTGAELERARGALAALGDPALLTARKEELEEELKRRSGEQEALTLALQVLQEASARLQTRFSPELNRLAGEYLARLTGQRYASLTLNRQLEGEAARAGDVLPHSALYLSRGTVDQLYLAVRLAVCRLCLPEKPPVILDDALTAFDDQRLKLALELLRELAREQQILLFTCQNREGEALAGCPVNRLELG